MRMKKIAKCVALGIAALGILASAGCGEQADKGEKTYKVGIVQLVEHSSLDDANRGFVDGLKARGYEEGKNLTIDRQNAQADQSNLQNIVQRFISDKVDLICAIAT
ncbi:ABC transporter substrate binding protein, partial [Selenomonas sp.]